MLMFQPEAGQFANAVNSKQAQWPNGIIPYVISPDYSE
jgi:hypothetical protein